LEARLSDRPVRCDLHRRARQRGVAQGVGGRYKAVSMLRAGYSGGGGAPAPGPLSADPAGSHQFSVEFNGMAEWQAISRKLSATPGIQDLDVAGLSNRGARVILRYPGSIAALADALSRQGLSLRNNGQSWTLSSQ